MCGTGLVTPTLGVTTNMANKCIFCGGSGKKSKEHIWSEWIHAYLPKQGDGYHFSEVQTAKWDEHLSTEKIKRQGYLSSKKLRVVCRSCNSGWMSKLETEVRPVLELILRKEVFDISPSDQIVLSRWVAMKVIVGEHSEGNTHVTPFSDRNALMMEGRVPAYFYICIGSHEQKHNSAWLRTSYTLSLSRKGPQPPLGNRNRNSQSIGMIVGPLFIWALAIRHDDIAADEFVHFNKVRQIFPSTEEPIKWPIKDILTDSQMSTIVYALQDIKHRPNVFYGGDLHDASNT